MSLQVAIRIQAVTAEGALDLRGRHDAAIASTRARAEAVAGDCPGNQSADGLQQEAGKAMPREMDQLPFTRHQARVVDPIGGLAASRTLVDYRQPVGYDC